MRAFGYQRPRVSAEAVRAGSAPGAAYLAGGTELLNLMKDGVQAHDLVVDINALPLKEIEVSAGRIRIGALARMAEVAAHPAVRTQAPVLSSALLNSASPQVRNMAAIGGNLLQRNRCGYFRDSGFPCNKRAPGSGCPARQGHNRMHALFGASEHCVAVHASDLAVSLAALEATVLTLGAEGARRIPFAEFYRLPGDTPQLETGLRPGELITAVEVPTGPLSARSRYLKLRDRESFEFAVVSVAACLTQRGGRVQEVRLAFGGVAPRPWRTPGAEAALRGRPLDAASLAAAAEAAVRGAQPLAHNGFKVELMRRALTGVLTELGRQR
ncbi:FAD binding domain-containing protein [Crossiella sp. CA198]|uniref:FAD binding domain-containing protein n=1 Tax=Crossiella sp. CA198 TaxID=3455607 RepID=UPI003F8D1D4C